VRSIVTLGFLAALLAGCGASDTVASEEVSAAVKKTASEGTSRMEISGKDDTETVVMRGVADYDRRAADFTFDVTSTEDASISGAKLRVIGSTVYLDSKTFGLTAGVEAKRDFKPWFKVEGWNEEVTLDTLLFPFPFLDPGRILSAFQRVSGAVESLGEEVVRGVPAEKYRLTLDLESLIETAPEAKRAELRKELAERKTKTEPVEVWIDEAGLARRLGFVIDGGPVTVDFFAFGIDVDVEAPPADQVEDLNQSFVGGSASDEESGSGEVTITEEPVEEDE
jgi:hypothetical protein